MKISAPALLLPVTPKGMPVKTGAVGMPKTSGIKVPASNSAASAQATNSQTYAAPGVTAWAVGRPGNEWSATTGWVSGQAASVPMTLSMKKGGAYSFAGAYSYSYTGKTPVVSITLSDAQGKVVSSSKSNALSYVATADGAGIGATLESHASFARRVNVGFRQVLSRSHILLRVFERGVGETQACGTGACAAMAAGRRDGLLDDTVRVSLPGGDLTVRWPGPGESLWLEGPALVSFHGQIDL